MSVRQKWESLLKVDLVAARIMLEGLKLEFITFPELSLECPPSVVTGHLQSSRLEEFIQPWLKAGIIGKGKAREGFFSLLFTVPKDENKWRPIIDLSTLNLKLKKRSFKMEDLSSIAKLIKPGMWAVKLDLKDAYFHVPLHPSIWKFFKFVLKKKGEQQKNYFFKKLPFGLTTAPWAFTRILAPLKKILRLQNIIVSAYLDDFLILANSREEALRHTETVIIFFRTSASE